MKTNSNLYIEKVMFSKDIDDKSYILKIPVVRKLLEKKELKINKPVTFFVGENGTGKSTLLEAVAICAGFNAEGGSRNFKFSTKSTESALNQYIKLSKKRHEHDGFFLRAESFYNVATEVDELQLNLDGYGGKSLHHQSHGESFMALVQNRFRGRGLYILDEPEAALSPLRQITLLAEINRLVKKDSQFIIATHSPILLAYPDSDIFELTMDDIKITEYKKTEHYTLTRQFLDNPEKMLKILFEE